MVIGQLPTTFVLAAEESLPLATEEPLIEDFKDSLQPLTVNDGQEEASASILILYLLENGSILNQSLNK